jgi:hypothetical protein
MVEVVLVLLFLDSRVVRTLRRWGEVQLADAEQRLHVGRPGDLQAYPGAPVARLPLDEARGFDHGPDEVA